MISAEACYELLFSASQLLGGLCSDAKKVSEASLLASFKAVASLPTTAAPPTGKYSRVSCFFLDAEERQGQVMMKGFSPPPLSLSLPLCTSLLHSLSHSLSANLWLCLVHSLTHTHTHPLSLKTSLLSQKQSYSLPLSLSHSLSCFVWIPVKTQNLDFNLMISIEQKVSEPSLKVFFCSPGFYFRGSILKVFLLLNFLIVELKLE